MGLFSLLFSYQGRVNRLQYWVGSLGVGFVGVFAVFVAGLMTFPGEGADRVELVRAAMGLVLSCGVIWSVMGWCAMALQVKRFHDRGQSGWLASLPMLPSLGIGYTLATSVLSGSSPAQIFDAIQPYMLALMAINVFLFVNLGCLPGTAGPNKYGDPPGGGSTSPRAPSNAPAPRAPAGIPGVTAKAQPQAAFSLGAAQDAIDRAAAQARADAMRPAPASAAAAPAGATPGFGRRTAR